MTSIIGKIVEIGDIDALEDMPDNQRSGLLIIASREQLKGGRNLFGEQVVTIAKDEHAALVAALAAADRALVYAACCLEHPTSPKCWDEHRKIVREARFQLQQREGAK